MTAAKPERRKTVRGHFFAAVVALVLPFLARVVVVGVGCVDGSLLNSFSLPFSNAKKTDRFVKVLVFVNNLGNSQFRF